MIVTQPSNVGNSSFAKRDKMANYMIGWMTVENFASKCASLKMNTTFLTLVYSHHITRKQD